MKPIDVDYNFINDIPGYWDGYWEEIGGWGRSHFDVDIHSKTLREYHRILWGRQLPNGTVFDLKNDSHYLSFKGMHFGSDSISSSFRYKSYMSMFEQIKKAVPDYQGFYKNYLSQTNTIAGFVIFPKHPGSMNQCRGTRVSISDRWDITLDCIRRFYLRENNPLSDVFENDRQFYEMFVDFKGYVDFFFLNDGVSDDYSSVDKWAHWPSPGQSALPLTCEEYFQYIDRELDFIKKRRERIRDYCAV